MTTALDRLRGMVAAARRDTLISTAEADILDRLVRVAEDEEDDRLDGALEELADNLRRALDCCVGRDDDGDDIPSVGCPTCDAVLDTLAECHGMSLCGPTAADVAESARDWIGDLLVERDEARAEVDRLRAEVASLRERPTRDELADYARRMRAAAAPDTDEADDGWEPGPWWSKDDGWDSPCWHVRRSRNESAARVLERKGGWSGYVWSEHQPMAPKEATQPTRRAAIEWCEAQPEMADIRAAYTSAPTVGATDAGPDAPALIVEGDAAKGAPLEGAVPAAPVSPAEQLDEETGADRPSTVDERIVGPREGEDWIGMGKHAGTSPYGYDVDTSGDDPVLVTNQVEADTMLLLCEWRDAGVSAQTMAKRLNDIGRRTRSGCAWTASSVRSRLLSAGSGYDEWHEVGR